MNKESKHPISHFFGVFCYICVFIFLTFLTISNLVVARHTISHMGELGGYEIQSILSILFAFLCCLLLYRILGIKVLKKISNKTLLFVVLIYMVLMAIAMLAFWGAEPLSDMGTMANYATSSSSLDWSYILKNPQQLAYLLVLKVVYRTFGDVVVGSFLLNCCFLLLIVVSLYKISNILFEKKEISRLVLILLMGFMPLIVATLLVYNDMIALGLASLAIWQALEFRKKRGWGNLLVLVLSISGAILIRQNTLIILVAIVIYLLFTLRRKNLLRTVIFMSGTIACVLGGQFMLKIFFANYSGEDFVNNTETIPMSSYVAMGMGVENDWSGEIGDVSFEEAGWWNTYNYACFDSYGTVGCNEKAKQDIIERLQYFLSNPIIGIKFYGHKILSQWNDPVFQYPYYAMNQDKTYGRENSEEILNANFYYNNVYHLMIILMAFLAVVVVGVRKKASWNFLLPLLAVFGYFLFSILWEAKSRYIMLVFPFLLPYAGAGIYYFGGFVGEVWRGVRAGFREKLKNSK